MTEDSLVLLFTPRTGVNTGVWLIFHNADVKSTLIYETAIASVLQLTTLTQGRYLSTYIGHGFLCKGYSPYMYLHRSNGSWGVHWTINFLYTYFMVSSDGRTSDMPNGKRHFNTWYFVTEKLVIEFVWNNKLHIHDLGPEK